MFTSNIYHVATHAIFSSLKGGRGEPLLVSVVLIVAPCAQEVSREGWLICWLTKAVEPGTRGGHSVCCPMTGHAVDAVESLFDSSENARPFFNAMAEDVGRCVTRQAFCF